MQQTDRSTKEEMLTEAERSLLSLLGKIARAIGAIGLVYASYSLILGLYNVISVTDNSKMWSYYKTIPGFFTILYIILFNCFLLIGSRYIFAFGTQIRNGGQSNKQLYFELALGSFKNAFLVLFITLILLLVASLMININF